MADNKELNDNAKLSMYFERYNPVMNDQIIAFLTELNNKADFNLDELGLENLEGLMKDVPMSAELKDSLTSKIKDRKASLATENSTRQTGMLFKNKDEVCNAFDKLIIAEEAHINAGHPEQIVPEIRSFIAHKDEYMKAHPEEKDEINSHIKNTFEHKDADNQFTVSEYIRIAYEREEVDYVTWLTGLDRTLPKGYNPARMTFDDVDINTGNRPQSAPTNKDNGKTTLKVGVIPETKDNEKDKDKNNSDNVLKVGAIPQTQTQPEREKIDEQPEMESAQIRIRSAYSDANEQWLDYLKLAAMRDMKVFDEELPDIDDIEATIDMLQKYEAKLSNKKIAELNDRVTDKILSSNELFELTPPSVLAEMYTRLKEKAAKTKDEKQQQVVANKLAKVTRRIDDLTAMVATDKDLYFADVTNIADTKRGYEKMFTARYADLTDAASNGKTNEIKVEAGRKLKYMQTALGVIESKIKAYDEVWNLSAVTAEKADAIDKRFDDIRQKMEGVEIDDETAKLVANFKFLTHDSVMLDKQQLDALTQQFPNRDFSTAKGYSDLAPAEMGYLQQSRLLPEAEPQFVDENGKQSHEWKAGCKVIPGSKLDKAILAAKQTVMLQNLGTEDEITPEFLRKEVSEQLPQTLYTLHIVDNANHGIVEMQDQFTNNKYFDEFKRNLGNIERPMSIGPATFEAGMDNIVNQTGGYAERLAERLQCDKDSKKVKNPNLKVTTKLFEPIQSIDKRAKDRLASDKSQGKQHYTRNLVKTAASAFALSATMRVVGTMAQSVTGLGWMAGGVSAALGVATTTMQVLAWRKQRKAAGLDSGFKAMIKDRRILMTLGTTALGVAAVTCMAIPGLQVAGAALGAASMALGGTNSAMTAYKASRDAGDSKFKAVLKAGGMLLAAGLGAWGGRATADAGINAYNEYNPNNNLFRHGEERIIDPGTEDRKELVVDRDALEADSKRYNEQYNISDRVHPGMSHDDYIRAVEQYNAAHPDHPIINPDEMLKHAYNAQDGRVYGPGYVQEHHLDPDVVNKVGHLINSDGTINDEAVKAFQGSDLWKESGLQNFVQRVSEPVESRPDLYASRDPHSTYSDGHIPTKEVNIPGKNPVIGTVMFDNDRPEGVAMVGVLGTLLGAKKLKDRIGSLKDGIKNVFKRKTPVQPKNPDEGGKPTTPPKKPEDTLKPTVPPKKPEENLKPTVPPKKPDERLVPILGELEKRKLLCEEFQMVYGYNPEKQKIKGDDGKYTEKPTNPLKDANYQEFVGIVEKERVAAGNKPMLEFLQERREKYLQTVGENLSKKEQAEFKDNPATHKITKDIRQDFLYSNSAENNSWSFAKFIDHAKGYFANLKNKNKTKENNTKTATVPVQSGTSRVE